ncbi:glycosyl hydrolase 115 family protein [Olivibacter sp. XZL3]|uniref:glycosyl hydrolase 115 family protein n=1 Tax=Olivibacter sp. XZL3 TaxID=1735116 RepID=UPI001065B6B7|nr:glycosyl hydrolase 115 family protein [Olivibacter sp. XZL3]
MKRIYVFLLILWSVGEAYAVQTETFVSFHQSAGTYPLSRPDIETALVTSENEWAGVTRALKDFQQDLKSVSGNAISLSTRLPTENGSTVIIAGTIGHSSLIDQLIERKKIDVDDIEGKWESTLLQLVENPVEGVKRAYVIAGSDKRGTIYGIYTLSAQIGVSPWYWWADVPIRAHPEIHLLPGRHVLKEPAVKYRGIFLNDEAPALTGWANEKFGGLNHRFYEKVFELILRLKGNYMWPAMWGKAFNDDDKQNPILADLYGVVVGTSHHEPMQRAQEEWKRYGEGPWDYQRNAQVLRRFWRDGIRNMGNHESIVTIGMRGDGDEPMSEESNIKLLEQIVKDQRQIIQEVTEKPAAETPQLWALYKEVQDYYDKGMRVPEDVTLLLCDDNWGNIRKLPSLDDKKRKGGYGIYYHFDYVGGPRNSKWINVTQIQRVWEQMNLAYQYGANRVWIVNVGDLKPMEYPISFFLDMAWDPNRFNTSNLLQHTEDWCTQQFGAKYASEAARLINTYTKYNHRVTPELLDENTYSLTNYNEFERVTNDYRSLLLDAMRLYYILPKESRDAFDELVLFPINACANLYEMYYAVAKNKYHANRNEEEANHWADQAKACFERDSVLTLHYNQGIANGKWPHMMDQIRIGYSSWNDPPKSIMPEISYVTTALKASRKVFAEADGYVSIEAEHYDKASAEGAVSWMTIPDLGRTLSGVTTTPVVAVPNKHTYLEYRVDLHSTGKAKLIILTSPTLNFNENKGLRYAVSVDGGKEKVVNINGHYRGELGEWQAKRIIETVTDHTIDAAGMHTIRIRPLEPGIVFQKIMLDLGGLKPTYLGAPESEVTTKQ